MSAHSLGLLSISSCIPSLTKSRKLHSFQQSDGSVRFLIGTQLAVRPSSLKRIVLKRQSTIMTVLLSLPTTKSKEGSTENLPKWSARAIRSFGMAELEARKIRYPNIGTEALLMGILVEGTSLAAKFLRANGMTHLKVREETLKLLGKSVWSFRSPLNPPLSEPAQKALDWAVDQKLKSGEGGEITTTYLLLGIWAQEESAGRKILESFGVNDEKAKELAKSMDKDFVLSFK